MKAGKTLPELANDVASYDRAVELETIGGKVAGLPAQVFGNN